MQDFKAFPKPVATIFFFIGVFSALAFRAIIIVQHVQPSYVRLLWYLAVVTNLIFFLYRYYISRKRRSAIHRRGLIARLQEDRPLGPEDRDVLVYLLTSIERSRENLNYLSIFILSAVAILIDIVMTLRS